MVNLGPCHIFCELLQTFLQSIRRVSSPSFIIGVFPVPFYRAPLKNAHKQRCRWGIGGEEEMAGLTGWMENDLVEPYWVVLIEPSPTLNRKIKAVPSRSYLCMMKALWAKYIRDNPFHSFQQKTCEHWGTTACLTQQNHFCRSHCLPIHVCWDAQLSRPNVFLIFVAKNLKPNWKSHVYICGTPVSVFLPKGQWLCWQLLWCLIFL